MGTLFVICQKERLLLSLYQNICENITIKI